MCSLLSGTNCLIIPTQFGFHLNHFTIHPVLDITESYKNVDDKCFYDLILLDMKNIFDCICYKIAYLLRNYILWHMCCK